MGAIEKALWIIGALCVIWLVVKAFVRWLLKEPKGKDLIDFGERFEDCEVDKTDYDEEDNALFR